MAKSARPESKFYVRVTLHRTSDGEQVGPSGSCGGVMTEADIAGAARLASHDLKIPPPEVTE